MSAPWRVLVSCPKSARATSWLLTPSLQVCKALLSVSLTQAESLLASLDQFLRCHPTNSSSFLADQLKGSQAFQFIHVDTVVHGTSPCYRSCSKDCCRRTKGARWSYCLSSKQAPRVTAALNLKTVWSCACSFWLLKRSGRRSRQVYR